MNPHILLALAVAFGVFSSGCEKDDSAETGYSCNGAGNCVQNENGSFESLSECHNSCAVSNSTLYSCEAGNCMPDSNGNFTSLSACQSVCGFTNDLASQGEGVNDVDGNSYNTIILNNGQEWMAENLRTSRYVNGDEITFMEINVQDVSLTIWLNLGDPAHTVYANLIENEIPYGRLYNWHVVTDPRKLCPDGWHVPTDIEWAEMELLLGMSVSDTELLGWRGSPVGGMLKTTESYWNSPNELASNTIGFSAVAGGWCSSGFSQIGEEAIYWSSTELMQNFSIGRQMKYDSGEIGRTMLVWTTGACLRCVKD